MIIAYRFHHKNSLCITGVTIKYILGRDIQKTLKGSKSNLCLNLKKKVN